MPRSKFKSDFGIEGIVAQYLDNVYSQLDVNCSFERVQSVKEQAQGIDLKIISGERTFNVDEKAQIHYINQKIPSFAFEISHLSVGRKVKDGWFMNENIYTDVYHLVFNIKSSNENTIEKVEDISGLQVLQISKKRLKFILEQRFGITEQLCREFDEDARRFNKWDKNYIPQVGAAYFYYSRHLRERPFNLVIKKHLLEEIGQIIWQK